MINSEVTKNATFLPNDIYSFYVESKNLYKAIGILYVTPFFPPTENHIPFVVAIYYLDSDNFLILIKSAEAAIDVFWKT